MVNHQQKKEIYDLIIPFLKEFEEEDYIWLIHIFALHKRIQPTDIPIYLRGFKNLKDIKNLIIIWIENDFYPEIRQELRSQHINKNKYYQLHLFTKIKNNPRFINFMLNFFNHHLLMCDLPLKIKIKFNKILNANNSPCFENQYIHLLLIVYYLINININISTIFDQGEKKFYRLSYEKNGLNLYISNPKFLLWAADYLNKKYKRTKNREFFNITFDASNKYKEYIYWYFDNLFLHNEEQYNKEIIALTKAWQQKSLREKNKTVIKEQKLETIAKFKKIAKSKVIDELINAEYQRVLLEIEQKSLNQVERDLVSKNLKESNVLKKTAPEPVNHMNQRKRLDLKIIRRCNKTVLWKK